MNTTNKSLALRITQGPVGYRDGIVKNDDGNHIANFEVSSVLNDGETKANGLLICEAFNVTHETGKTPRELVGIIKAAIAHEDKVKRTYEADWLVEARKIIK